MNCYIREKKVLSVDDHEKRRNEYYEVLKTYGSIDMWFVKFVLLGPPGLGKTTVRKRITGKIVDIESARKAGKVEAVEPSTNVKESEHSVAIRNLSEHNVAVTGFSNTTAEVDSKWELCENLDDEVRTLLQFVYSDKNEKATESTDDQGTDDVPNLASSNDIKESSPSSPTTYSPPKAPMPQTLTDWITSLRENLPGKNLEDITQSFKGKAHVKMEDTGGQPEFMDMLPALTIGPALYLLFCKLTDSLQSHYKVSYRSKSGETSKEVESTYTVEEVLLMALSSVCCFQSYSDLPKFKSNEATDKHKELIECCNDSRAHALNIRHICRRSR